MITKQRGLPAFLRMEANSTGIIKTPSKSCGIPNGFSLVEAIIAIVILSVAASASIQLYSSFTLTADNARIRDGITSIITRDSENMKYFSSLLWKCLPTDVNTICTTAAAQGGLTEAYAPPTANCQNSTLASAAASVDTRFAASTTSLSIDTNSSAALRNPTISRTISHTGNIIKLSYSTTSPVPLNHVTYIAPAAQVWCTL